MTVLERIKELGEKRGAAHRAYKAKPSKALHDAWLVATTNLDWAVEDALPHLIAVAEAAASSPCRHTNEYASGGCPVCAALNELTKGACDER